MRGSWVLVVGMALAVGPAAQPLRLRAPQNVNVGPGNPQSAEPARSRWRTRGSGPIPTTRGPTTTRGWP